MKRQSFHFVITSVAAALLVVSCEENVSDVWSKYKVSAAPHYLSISERSCYFGDAAGGAKNININASNTSWEITDLPDWLSVDKTSGTGSTTIYLKCESNPSPTDNRAALFIIRSKEADWDYSVSVSTSQVRSKKYATPETTSVTLDGKESRQAVSVTSNVTDWSVSVAAASASESFVWLTATKSEGTIALQASPNPHNVARRAYVIVKTDDEEQQITVTQRAGNISSTLDKLTYTYEASSQTVTITSDAPWAAQTASSWIETIPSSGSAGTTEVMLRTTANNSFDERSGYVYFVMADDNKVEMPVEQGAVTFSLSNNALSFDREGGQQSIVINTNAEWELSSTLPDWVSLSNKEGKGTTEVGINIKKNTDATISPRTYTISFKPKGIDKNYDVIITQNGQHMSFDITPLQFTNKGASLSFSFEATGSWSITTSDSWIKVNTSSGAGDATCMVTVEENTGEDRMGEVVLHFYEEIYRIPVSQQGIFMTLSTNDLRFGSTGGQLRVDISSNTRWDATAKNDAAWLDVNPKTGEDNDSLFIIASDNPSVEGRDGEVIVTPKDRQSLLVSVAQAARYLNISTSSIELTAVEGTSELITIDSDGDIDVTTESDWITINKVSEKSFTISVSENNKHYSRGGVVRVFLSNLTSGEISKTISVMQAVHTLSVSTENITFTAAGGTSDVITAETDGAISVTTESDWITINKVSEKSFTISVSENNKHYSRGGVVRVFLSNLTSGEISKTISVTQAVHTLSVSTENITFTAAGGTSDVITAETDGVISVTTESDWLKIDTDGNTFTVTATDNNTTEVRNGTVKASLSNLASGEISKTIYVTQAVHTLSVSTHSLTFEATGGTSQKITVQTDGVFNITADSEWLTINRVSDMIFIVNALANESYRSRTGKVVISLSNLFSGKIEKTVFITQKGTTEINGHEFVDLGLPSGLLWATCNVGANSPEKYGSYFAWGETWTKTIYDWETYTWRSGMWLAKYITDNYPNNGIFDNKIVLDLSDDAAHVLWGNNWRMATKDEWQELRDNCTWTWTTQGGHKGRQVTSKSNGNSIFLPAAGDRWNSELCEDGQTGNYWSSSLNEVSSQKAWNVYFGSGSVASGDGDRGRGRSVRPVCRP